MPSSVALNLVLSEARVSSGDQLRATILLDSADPDTVVHEFHAEVRGISRTGWVNIHTDKIYETEREFFNVVLPLCQSMMALRPGRHRFALRVAIPDTMPSSFESQFGWIRYTVKLVLITNAEHSSAMEVFPFFVVARSFFDDVPQAVMQPIDYRDEIDFTVCTLPFGTVYLRIALPRTAFCLGETLPLWVGVRNATRKTIKDCRLHLLLKTQFEAMSRYEHASDRKLVEQIIDTWPIGRIKARTEKNFDNCSLRIPETAIPTHNNNSSGAANFSGAYNNQQQQQQQSTGSNYLTLNSQQQQEEKLLNGTDTPSRAVTFDVLTPGSAGGMVMQRGINTSALMMNNQMDVSGSGILPVDTTNIIMLSYVLRFNALPGIETEIPLVITSQGYRDAGANSNRTKLSEEMASPSAKHSDTSAPSIPFSSTTTRPSPKSGDNRPVSALSGDSLSGGGTRSGKRVSIYETERGAALYYC